MNSYLYLDIETLPNVDQPPDLDDPEFKALVYKKVPKNYSKTSSITKWMEEHAEEVWRKGGLDYRRGKLLCIGVAYENGVTVIREPLERDMLSRLSKYIEGAPTIVGHTLTFDLPWLCRLAMKHEKYSLVRRLDPGKWGKRVDDISEAWMFGARDWSQKTSLDDMATYLGLGCKTILRASDCAAMDLPEGTKMTGALVYDAYRAGLTDLIERYCAQDVELTRTIHQRLKKGGCFYRQDSAGY
jgi:hypothetical protein